MKNVQCAGKLVRDLVLDMAKVLKKNILNIAIIFLILLFDQASKFYVISIFEGSINEIFLTSFLNLHLIWNEGIAFGLFSFESDLYYNLISLLIFIIITVLFLLMKKQDQYTYFYAMIVGGALGNLLDRIRYSSVPDFIDFHISDFHWFVFNVADIFISLGVFCLIIAEIFFNDKDKSNEKI